MKPFALKHWAHLGLSIALLLIPLCCPASTIQKTQDSIRKIESQTKTTQAAITDANRQHTEAQASIKKIDKEIAAEQLRLQQLLSEINTTEQELEAQKNRIATLQEKHQEAIEALKLDLQRAYRTSREPWIKSILSTEDYSETQRVLKWIGIIQSSQKTHADNYLASAKTLEHAQIALEETRESLLAQQQQNQMHQVNLEKLRTKQMKEAETFKKLLVQSKSKLSTLNSDGQSLTRLLTQLKLQKSQKNKKSKRPPTNSDWPVSGSLQHNYGDAREDGKLKWQGWYISAPRGKPVRAVADGKVIFSNWLRGFGMLVIVDHGSDYHTLYAHADALGVAEGTQVKKGEVIAYTGSSGGAESPGIYFEVRHRGQTINPSQWLKRA